VDREAASEGNGMSLLPVTQDDEITRVLEPNTGELVPISEASDRAILAAEKQLSDDVKVRAALRRALAHEVSERYGFGVKHEAGFGFDVEQTRSWQKVGTIQALLKLWADEKISEGELADAAPWKRVPDARKCKALVERLMLSGELEAAKALAATCSVSAPRIIKVWEESIPSDVA
jgi:hypothetical protein